MVKKRIGQEVKENAANAIGYKMGVSMVGVYAISKTSHVENSKHG